MAKPKTSKTKKPRAKRPEHWHQLSPEDHTTIQGSGLSIQEFFAWKAWKKKREARAKRKAKIAGVFVAPNRKTCIYDGLNLRTTAGLPSSVRARLLYMASWERRGRISGKLVKLIEPLIKEGMLGSSAEILRVLELEEPKPIYQQVTVVYNKTPKEGSAYVYGCNLRVEAERWHTREKSISIDSCPRKEDLEQSAWVIEEVSPKDENEVYIVKLAKILDQSVKNHGMFDKLMKEADGIPLRLKKPKDDFYDREMSRKEKEIILRTGEGKLVLLRDSVETGLHLLQVGEVEVLNLTDRRAEPSMPFVSTLTHERRR